jgi:hypothetical protein
METTISVIIIIFIFYIMKAQSDLNRERINCDRWRDTALMLTKELQRRKR